MTEPAPSTKTYSWTTACCWLVILGIVGFVVVKNIRTYRTMAERPLTAAVPPPDVSLEITSRMLIGETSLLSRMPSGSDPAMVSRQLQKMLAAIDSAAVTTADKLNAIAVIGELAGSESAIKRLDQLQAKLVPNPLLAGDAKVLRNIYMHGAESITGSDRDGLLNRHEWFGKLALTFGLLPENPQRQAMIHDAVHTTIVGGSIGVVLLLAFVAGLVLLIAGIVFLKIGRLRFSYQPTPPLGPPAFLETFALWLGIWVITSIIWRLLGKSPEIFTGELLMTVVSLAIALWPLRRGVWWEQLRLDLGWHVGRGVAREIFAGVIGYIAGLPILAMGLAVTTVLIRKSDSHPTHPILRDLGSDAGAVSLLGVYLAASVLAPLIEETMFRGALYGHLRRRHRVIVSVIVVSFLFAAIHPQGWTVIPLLGSIAIVLAMLREWRGSLVSCMTAHALNNGAAMTMVLLLLR